MRSLLILLLFAAGMAHAEEPARPIVFRGKTLLQCSGELHSLDPRTRRRAATALGLGPFGKQAIPTLLEAPRDEDHERSLSVLMALYQFAPDSPEVAAALVPYVNLTYNSMGARGRFFPCEASQLGPVSVPLLQERIRQMDPGAGVCKWTLFSGMDRSALPLLKKCLKDEVTAIRAAGATALGDMKEDAAGIVPLLLPLLHDQELLVRVCAMQSLRKTGVPPAAIPLLVERLYEYEDSASTAAVLAGLGKPGIAALRSVFASASPELRNTILKGVIPAEQDTFPLLLDGLGHPDVEVRRRAAVELSRSYAALDEVLPRLTEAMADSDAETRGAVVRALGEIVPPRRDIVLILAKTLFDGDSDVSAAAAGALLSLGPNARAAVPQLLDGLKHHNPRIRARAALILGDVQGVRRDIVLALCASLKDDSADVRSAAAEALARLGPVVLSIVDEAPVPGGSLRREIVLPALRRCQIDKEQDVRIAAGAALVSLGDRSEKLAQQLGVEVLDPLGYLFGTRRDFRRQWALGPLSRMGKAALPALPFLLLVLYEDNLNLSPGVMEVLASMGPAARAAIPALRDTLHNSESSVKRACAVRTLLKLGDEGQGVLREGLALPDSSLHNAILGGLRQAGPEAKPLLPSVVLIARDADGDWNRAALGTLQAIGARGDPARRIFLDALDAEDEYVCRIACAALGAMGPEARAAIPSLLGCLLEPQAYVRCEAVKALGQIVPDDRRVLPALVETLTDPDESVRKEAVIALGAVGRTALPALRSACRDRDENVRLAAACSLGRRGENRDECNRQLRSLMVDGKDVGVRVEACKALWKRERTREVVPVLALLLRDDAARSAARDALCELDGAQDDVRAFLRPLLRHELRAVRLAAWQVLEKTSPELTTALVNAR